jgi:hypothetical protein
MVRGVLKRGCEEVSRATSVAAPRSRAEAAIVTGAAAVGVLSRKIQRAFLFPELGLKKTISRTFLGRKRLLMKRHTAPNSSSLSVTVSTVAQGVVSPYWSIPLTCLTANTSYLGHIYQHPTPSKSTKFPPSHLLSSRHQSGMFHLEQVYWKLHSLSRLYIKAAYSSKVLQST